MISSHDHARTHAQCRRLLGSRILRLGETDPGAEALELLSSVMQVRAWGGGCVCVCGLEIGPLPPGRYCDLFLFTLTRTACVARYLALMCRGIGGRSCVRWPTTMARKPGAEEMEERGRTRTRKRRRGRG